MYVKSGDFDRAISLLGKHDDPGALLDVARSLDKTEVKSLTTCATLFREKFKNHGYAQEVYLKLNDIPSLMELHMDFQKVTASQAN